MSDNIVKIGKPKTFKFGKEKGEIKKSYQTTFNPSGQMVSQKVTKYDRKGKVKKEISINPPLTAKTPYMMYGEEAAPMMGGSPLAKYGCSKKYKSSGVKAMGGVEEVDPTTFEEKPLDPAKTSTGKNVFVPQYKVKSNPKYFKKGNSRNKTQRTRR